jgi:hypothetical protein
MNRRNALRAIGTGLGLALTKSLPGQTALTDISDAQIMAVIPDIATAADVDAGSLSARVRAGDQIVRVVRMPISNIREPRLSEYFDKTGNRVAASIPCTPAPSKDQYIQNPDGTTSPRTVKDPVATYCTANQITYLPSRGLGDFIYTPTASLEVDRAPITLKAGPAGMALFVTHITGSATPRPQLTQAINSWANSCSVPQLTDSVIAGVLALGSARLEGNFSTVDNYQVVTSVPPVEPRRGLAGMIDSIKSRACTSQANGLGTKVEQLTNLGPN